jgi:hypothetical protein
MAPMQRHGVLTLQVSPNVHAWHYVRLELCLSTKFCDFMKANLNSSEVYGHTFVVYCAINDKCASTDFAGVYVCLHEITKFGSMT